MSEPSAVASSMADILPVLLERLVAVTSLPAERVNAWVGDADPPQLQADQDLVVRLAGVTPDQSWYGGGGRYAPRVTERVEVQVRTRLSLDPVGGAATWLTDASLGHVRLRDLVLSALMGFLPTDVEDNVLVTNAVSFAAEQRPRPRGGGGRPADWGSETLAFDVPYLQRVDLTLSDTLVRS